MNKNNDKFNDQVKRNVEELHKLKARKLMIPRSSTESNNFIIKRMINDRFFNLVGITRAWRSTSPSCQREHRHKTNVKDQDWQMSSSSRSRGGDNH
jgi:hypothetical protein